jgi:hypothetical protein
MCCSDSRLARSPRLRTRDAQALSLQVQLNPLRLLHARRFADALVATMTVEVQLATTPAPEPSGPGQYRRLSAREAHAILSSPQRILSYARLRLKPKQPRRDAKAADAGPAEQRPVVPLGCLHAPGAAGLQDALAVFCEVATGGAARPAGDAAGTVGLSLVAPAWTGLQWDWVPVSPPRSSPACGRTQRALSETRRDTPGSGSLCGFDAAHSQHGKRQVKVPR